MGEETLFAGAAQGAIAGIGSALRQPRPTMLSAKIEK